MRRMLLFVNQGDEFKDKPHINVEVVKSLNSNDM
jgi:hypothetical protein